MGHVLVIDDDPVMRSTIRKILMREGHEVREACNSGEGLDLFRREAANAVVTDLDMPAQEGVAAIVELFDGTPGARVLGVSGGPAPGAVWPDLPTRGPGCIKRLVPEGTAQALRG